MENKLTAKIKLDISFVVLTLIDLVLSAVAGFICPIAGAIGLALTLINMAIQ